MDRPRYKPSSHYRTRRSCRERIALCPSADLGATALDRPIIGVLLRPRAPSARRCAAVPTVPRLVFWVIGVCVAAGVVLGAVLGLLAR